MKPFKHAKIAFDDSGERDRHLWIHDEILKPKHVNQLYAWLGNALEKFKPKPKSTAAKKAKGRAGCMEIVELLRKYAPDLKPDDIRITSSGACGEDVLLSPAARDIYPFAIESKNTENINVWKAYEQAQAHAKDTKHTPVLFFKRNRSELMVCLMAEDFVRLIR